MRRLCVLFAFTGLVAGVAGAWEIPLTAVEYQGVSGPRKITCGVPLLAGQAKEVKDLSILAKDSAGKLTPVSAQFRELARWWRADNSLRWVLVDFQTDIGAGETRTFVLTDAKQDVPASKLSVQKDDDFITVSTGPAKFVVNRRKFNFLEKVVLDLNGDGKLDDDENILASTAGCGTVMEDGSGRKYFGSAGTVSVEVLEEGPQRVCVRARGRHPAPEEGGYAPGLYTYDVFLNFYADSADVFSDVVVGNNPAVSVGNPALEDGSLILKLAGGAKDFRLYGEKAVDGKLTGGSVCLYQDSNGADAWAKCPGFAIMDTPGWSPLKEQLTTFRGFKVWKVADAKKEDVAAGDHARGLVQAWNDRAGMVVHTKNFWQQFPKAVEVGADGTVRIGLWPREFKYPHRLLDSSAKGHEIVLRFGAAKDVAPAEPAEAFAGCWDSRVMLRPAAEHMGAAGALSDLGPYTPPTKGLDKRPGTATVANGPRMLTDDQLYGNAYGWQVFGERWRSNGGHGTHGARQPINEDNYLYLWYITGAPEWFAAGDARSRHFRDVRYYRIDDQDALSFTNWMGFREAHNSENKERPQPDTAEVRKYQAGLPDYGSPWAFPNPEHCVLDLLYDRYLLTGDVRSFENMRVAAGFGGCFAIDHAPAPAAAMEEIGPRIGRDNGWCWRTLERYWELTGDKRAREMLDLTIKGFEPLIGKSELWFGNSRKGNGVWFSQIFSRAVAATALHTGDPKALEICKALAVGKEKETKAFSTLYAVLYHLTGEAKYKEIMAERLKGDSLLSIGGYYTPSDHWYLTQPPAQSPQSAKQEPKE